MLFRTVGIKKFTADIYDFFTVPHHCKPRIVLDNGNNRCLEIFTVGK